MVAVSGTRDARPPSVVTHTAFDPDTVTTRSTAILRPLMKTWAYPVPAAELPETELRKRWVSAIGVEATAELLRAIRAGQRGAVIKRPWRLSVLLSQGVVALRQQVLCVPNQLPDPPPPAPSTPR